MSLLVRFGKASALAIMAVVPGVSTAGAQSTVLQTPTPPGHYAITNARIVTVSGRTIENGTVVIKDGLIATVGASVQVPADAWVIDASGLTVYPGLVNSMSTVALPATLKVPRGGAGGFGQGGGGQGAAGADPADYSWGPEDRPGTFSWVNAGDELNAGDDAIEKWRSAGFTSVVATPERGYISGQAAWVNLAGERPNDMVVRTPVAMRINLQAPGFPGYPQSLMGGIAYIKQVFFDAAHYDLVWSAYDSDPRGKERPGYDRALEPLRRVLAAQWPVLMPGVREREIRRAIAIAAETKTRPVVYGVHEGFAAAADLAAAGVPTLVNIDWPRRAREADPDADIPLETLRFWDRAPTTPAALESAGVAFAMYSSEADPSGFAANVRRAMRLGLSPDAAVRAVTLAPAQIFGVADRLGSVEPGKIANLVVTDGDLFGEDTKTRMVFVDGRKFDVGSATTASLDEADESEDAGGRGAAARGGRGAAGEELAFTAPVEMTRDRGPVSDAAIVLIQHATVMTVTSGTLENADVLIRDGKIAEIGRNLTAPRGAQVVDATGKFVTPGIIDAHSHIAADAINEGAVAVSAMVGIEDVLDPTDRGIYLAAAGGVTSANVLHGSANPIGGKNAVIKARWGEDADGLLFDGAPPGIKFALGENVKRDRNPDRYPNSRMGVQDVVRQAFLDAQEYQKSWSDYEVRRRRDRNAVPPRRDLKLEALAQVLAGDRLVHAHSYRADEILQLLRVAEEFNFRIATFQHVLEGYKVADEIAAHGAGASTFSDWWAYKVEAYDAIPYNAALMTQRGVVTSINSDSGEEMRHLNQEAAKTMKWGGLSETEALKLVTLNPAIQLGVSDRVGSIEVGKDADLVIFQGHPLSTFGVVQQTYIDGKLYFDREHDQQVQQELDAEKQKLLERYRPQQRGTRVTTEDAEEVR